MADAVKFETADSLFVPCDGCGYKFKLKNLKEEPHGLYCQKCRDTWMRCGECGDVYPTKFMTRVSGKELCCACLDEDYVVCNLCQEYVSDDEIVDVEEGQYCHACHEIRELDGQIHDYSYTPRLKFHGMDWETRGFMGVELEINTMIPATDHTRMFKAYLKEIGAENFFYFKRDGSINGGYEIVTHPFTLQTSHRSIPWRKILKWLRENHARSYETGECGLHVHVSADGITRLDEAKLKMFMSRCHDEVVRFSKRKSLRYCQIEGFGLGELQAFVRNKYRQPDRHVAVNTSNDKGTVEFRIFRGTLSYERFMASLQFSEAVCRFVQDHGVASICGVGGRKTTWGLFRDWLHAKGTYQLLENYLIKEKI